MASTLPTPLDCCTTCTDPVSVNVPGTAGSDGDPGAAGTNGLNAVSLIDGGLTLIPAYGVQVDVPLVNPPGSQWMGIGQIVFIEPDGYYKVIDRPNAATATLLNLGYTGNTDGDGLLLFVDQSRISPGGIEGTSGATPTDALLAGNNLNDVDSVSDSRDNLGLGTAAVLDEGTGNGELPKVDDGGGLTAGEVVFATANGLESKDDTAAQAALGLGSMATQDANNVNITGGTITGIAVGTVGIPKDLLVFSYEEATTVNGSTFTAGTWANIVPLNTEVVDSTGSGGSVAAGVVTLTGAGTYRARWRVIGSACDLFTTRLRNITTNTVLGYSTNAKASSTDTSDTATEGVCRFTVTAGTTLQIEGRCSTIGTFGSANSFGANEVYATLELEKEIA